MLNNILNLEGVAALNKKQKSQVKGSGTCAVMLYGYGGPVFKDLTYNQVMKVIKKMVEDGAVTVVILQLGPNNSN